MGLLSSSLGLTSNVLRVAHLVDNNSLSEDPRINPIHSRHVVSDGVDEASLQIPFSFGCSWLRLKSRHAFFYFGNLAIIECFGFFRSLIKSLQSILD